MDSSNYEGEIITLQIRQQRETSQKMRGEEKPRNNRKVQTQTRVMLGLKSHVNIQMILRINRIQENHQNIDKQNKTQNIKNKQKQIQTEFQIVI